MNIDLKGEIKAAIKEALSEWTKENKDFIGRTPQRDADDNVLLSIKQFCEKHSFMSPGVLYQYSYNREWNKFDACMTKLGRKVLIKEKEALDYFSNPPPESQWIYDQNKYKKKD